jgi:hypothetical protein
MLISRHDWGAVDHLPIVHRGECTAIGWTPIPQNRCQGASWSSEKRAQDRFERQGCICRYTGEVA